MIPPPLGRPCRVPRTIAGARFYDVRSEPCARHTDSSLRRVARAQGICHDMRTGRHALYTVNLLYD